MKNPENKQTVERLARAFLRKGGGKLKKRVQKTERLGAGDNIAGSAVLRGFGLGDKVSKVHEKISSVKNAVVSEIKPSAGIFGISREDAQKVDEERKAWLVVATFDLDIATVKIGEVDLLAKIIEEFHKHEFVWQTTLAPKVLASLGAVKAASGKFKKETTKFSSDIERLAKANYNESVSLMPGFKAKHDAFNAAVGEITDEMVGIKDHFTDSLMDKMIEAIVHQQDSTKLETSAKFASQILSAGLSMAAEAPSAEAKVAIGVVKAVKPWLERGIKAINLEVGKAAFKRRQGESMTFRTLNPEDMAKMIVAKQKDLIRLIIDSASMGLDFIPGWSAAIKPALLMAVDSVLDGRVEKMHTQLLGADDAEKLAQEIRDGANESAFEGVKELVEDEFKKKFEADKFSGALVNAGKEGAGAASEIVSGNPDVLEDFAKSTGQSALNIVKNGVDFTNIDPSSIVGLAAPIVQPILAKIVSKLPFVPAAEAYGPEDLLGDIESIYGAGRAVREPVRPGTVTQGRYEIPTRTKSTEEHPNGFPINSILSRGLTADPVRGGEFLWVRVTVPPKAGARGNVENEVVDGRVYFPDWEFVAADAGEADQLQEFPRVTSKGFAIKSFKDLTESYEGKDMYVVAVNNVWGHLDPDTLDFYPRNAYVSSANDPGESQNRWTARHVALTGYSLTGYDKNNVARDEVKGTWYRPFTQSDLLLFVEQGGADIWGEWVSGSITPAGVPFADKRFSIENVLKKVSAGSKPPYWDQTYGPKSA